MSVQSNTVHVALTLGTDLATIQAAFEPFGEVACVDYVEADSKVAVVYFDVRHAAQAIEALGTQFCSPGPQRGVRSVRLAGDVKFESQDFAGISGVQNADDGTFILEFYDVRDAARYDSQLVTTTHADATKGGAANVLVPPGLEASQGFKEMVSPPGLGRPTMANSAEIPPGIELPPGLVAVTQASQKLEAVCQVTVSCLPNKLLSKSMMEAVLQQAGVENGVLDFSTKCGKSCGEAIVNFSSFKAAEKCAAHFKGCMWDQMGNSVLTQLVKLIEDPLPSMETAPPQLQVADPFGNVDYYEEALQEEMFAYQQMYAASGFMSDLYTVLGEAEGHVEQEVPVAVSAAMACAWSGATPGLSAEAPAFVPAASLVPAYAPVERKTDTSTEQASQTGEPAKVEKVSRSNEQKAAAIRDKLLLIGSDTSTEVGESEEEEKDNSSPKPTSVAV